MRDTDVPYAPVSPGDAGGAAPLAALFCIGITQPTLRSRVATATKLVRRMDVISRLQLDRSNASRTRRGSRLVRLAVNTRSHLALLYNSSEREGRLIVPIHPSPVRRSTLPLRLSTGMSRPSISVFTG